MNKLSPPHVVSCNGARDGERVGVGVGGGEGREAEVSSLRGRVRKEYGWSTVDGSVKEEVKVV